MQIRYILAAIFGAAGFVFSMWRFSIWNEIVDEVNKMALPGDRAPEWTPRSQSPRVMQLHRQFYPKSSKRTRVLRVGLLAVVSFLLAFACVAVFKPTSGSAGL